MLTLQSVEKSYATPDGPVPVLRGVSMAVQPGETVALTGESGSGKSTLIHAMAGLEAIDHGSIDVFGARVTAMGDAARAALRRDRVGLVFQQFNLIPSLRVSANIDFQARLAGRVDRDWIAHVTGMLGLDGLVDRYPENLSGGQQQRVAVARALAHRPELVLADEPTGNLDREAGDAVLALMLELIADGGCTLVLVTHNPRLAGMMTRTLRLESGCLA